MPSVRRIQESSTDEFDALYLLDEDDEIDPSTAATDTIDEVFWYPQPDTDLEQFFPSTVLTQIASCSNGSLPVVDNERHCIVITDPQEKTRIKVLQKLSNIERNKVTFS